MVILVSCVPTSSGRGRASVIFMSGCEITRRWENNPRSFFMNVFCLKFMMGVHLNHKSEFLFIGAFEWYYIVWMILHYIEWYINTNVFYTGINHVCCWRNSIPSAAIGLLLREVLNIRTQCGFERQLPPCFPH